MLKKIIQSVNLVRNFSDPDFADIKRVWIFMMALIASILILSITLFFLE